MNKFERFANEMSQQLFEMRGEDLITSVIITDDNEQIPVDFIDKILGSDIHIEQMKSLLRMSVLKDVTANPDEYDMNGNDYVYSGSIYDHTYLVDAYIEDEYHRENPVMKTVIVCDDCGGINVQSKSWVRPNQNNEFVDLMTEEINDNFCDDCNVNVTTTSIQVDVKDPKYQTEEKECTPVTDDPKVNLVVDAVIKDLKANFELGDYTVLEELLQMIPRKNLINSLPEEQWKDHK